MEQKLKIRTLITVCVLVLIGLCSIQFYLVRNTYNLHKKEYLINLKKSIDPVVESPEMDALKDSLMDYTKDLIFQKQQGTLNQPSFDSLLSHYLDSSRNFGNVFIESHREDYPELDEVKLRFQFSEIVYNNNVISDTILHSGASPFVYAGQSLNSREIHNYTFGSIITNVENEKESLVTRHTLFVKYSIDFEATRLKQEVFQQMMWMLIAAIVLLLAVVFLFFRVLKALILQKEIAEMKTDLANNISHELKTPLTSIGLVAKSLRKPEVIDSPEQRGAFLDILDRQNSRIHSLIDHIMETTVLQVSEKQPVHIEQLLQTIATEFPISSHKLELDIEKKNSVIQTDPLQLERVIENLLKNAQKFSSAGSTIMLKAYPTKDSYEIEVVDQGIGIAEAHQEKIFDKFYRVSGGLIHDTKGLGLGLYLSLEIVESLGGKISVSSKINKGSTFKISLPLSV